MLSLPFLTCSSFSSSWENSLRQPGARLPQTWHSRYELSEALTICLPPFFSADGSKGQSFSFSLLVRSTTPSFPFLLVMSLANAAVGRIGHDRGFNLPPNQPSTGLTNVLSQLGRSPPPTMFATVQRSGCVPLDVFRPPLLIPPSLFVLPLPALHSKTGLDVALPAPEQSSSTFSVTGYFSHLALISATVRPCPSEPLRPPYLFASQNLSLYSCSLFRCFASFPRRISYDPFPYFFADLFYILWVSPFPRSRVRHSFFPVGLVGLKFPFLHPIRHLFFFRRRSVVVSDLPYSSQTFLFRQSSVTVHLDCPLHFCFRAFSVPSITQCALHILTLSFSIAAPRTPRRSFMTLSFFLPTSFPKLLANFFIPFLLSPPTTPTVSKDRCSTRAESEAMPIDLPATFIKTRPLLVFLRLVAYPVFSLSPSTGPPPTLSDLPPSHSRVRK